MNAFRKIMLAVSLIALLGLMPTPSHAQALQNTSQSVALTYAVGESVTVSLNQSTIALTTTDQPITGTVTYALAPTRFAVGYVFYFNTVNALTNGGTGNVPTSSIMLGDNPCNQTLAQFMTGVGASSSMIFAGVPAGQQSVCNNANGAGQFVPLAGTDSGTISISTSIKISSPPTTFGNYTGTLQLMAASI